MPYMTFWWLGVNIVPSKLSAALTECTNMIHDLLMLFRWARDGWEVHPINIKDEFGGWI